MTKVVIDQTISLDGFTAGPDDDAKHPLGTHGGEHLFDWYQGGEVMHGDKRFAPVGANRDIVETMWNAYGSFVAGRRVYDFTHGWDGTHPCVRHVFIVTHRPAEAPKGESTFAFVGDVPTAIAQAKRAAGAKDVAIGTASIAEQALAAGLVDEIWLHVAPMVLGGGVRFLNRAIRLEQIESVSAPGATHLRYRVISG